MKTPPNAQEGKVKNVVLLLAAGAIGGVWFLAGAYAIYTASQIKITGGKVDYPHVVYDVQEKTVETEERVPVGYTDVRYAADILKRLPACAMLVYDGDNPPKGVRYCASIDPGVFSPRVCDLNDKNYPCL